MAARAAPAAGSWRRRRWARARRLTSARTSCSGVGLGHSSHSSKDDNADLQVRVGRAELLAERRGPTGRVALDASDGDPQEPGDVRFAEPHEVAQGEDLPLAPGQAGEELSQ